MTDDEVAKFPANHEAVAQGLRDLAQWCLEHDGVLAALRMLEIANWHDDQAASFKSETGV